MGNFQGIFGIILIPALALGLSENRNAHDMRAVFRLFAGGIGLQFILALILLGLPGSRLIVDIFSQAIGALQSATEAGLQMVFGYLAG